MYLDHHTITALAHAGVISFSVDEILEAEGEMRASGELISSIEHQGIFLGRTPGGALSAYARRFWIGTLNEERDDSRAIFDAVEVPTWVLFAIETDQEALGRKLSLMYCRTLELDSEASQALLRASDGMITSMLEYLRKIGVLETTKKSLHVTQATLDVLAAGGTQSGRLNAIVARYAAIMDDPRLAEEIANTEALEREAKNMKQRASRASVTNALAILDEVPDVEPAPGDELPAA